MNNLCNPQIKKTLHTLKVTLFSKRYYTHSAENTKTFLELLSLFNTEEEQQSVVPLLMIIFNSTRRECLECIVYLLLCYKLILVHNNNNNLVKFMLDKLIAMCVSFGELFFNAEEYDDESAFEDRVITFNWELYMLALCLATVY